LVVGAGWTQATINGGRRSSSATSYLGPEFISRNNLHVLVNTRVTRVLQTGTMADGVPEILGVEFVNGGNTSTQYLDFVFLSSFFLHSVIY
jgi:choline dehydrogenase-like flavoprotein